MVCYQTLLLCCMLGYLVTVQASALPYQPSPADNLPGTKLETQFDAASFGGDEDKVISGDDLTYFSWLKYLLSQHKIQISANQEKRGLGLSRHQSSKRSNGVWIWMPAQGYVSVPQQQALAPEGSAGGENSGKVMRYGK